MQRSGWIVNFSSTSSIKSVEGGAVYSASKFAVEDFTEGLAIELKSFGINCLIVEPGAIGVIHANIAKTAIKAFEDGGLGGGEGFCRQGSFYYS